MFVARTIDSGVQDGAFILESDGWRLERDAEEMARAPSKTIVSLIERDFERLTAFERSVLYGEPVEKFAAALALHFDRAEEPERAMHYLALVGQEAYASGAHPSARVNRARVSTQHHVRAA